MFRGVWVVLVGLLVSGRAFGGCVGVGLVVVEFSLWFGKGGLVS